MKTGSSIAIVALAMLLQATGSAQPPTPPIIMAPLLYARVDAPPGVEATFYQGSPIGKTFPVPAPIGLRPGYVYRIKLSGFREHPGVALYPTLEVRGTLEVTPKLNPAEYPAPIPVNDQDIERAIAGAVVTKVVFLERPDSAVPEATRPNHPLEFEVPPGADAVAEARQRGRLMVIVRLGERAVPPEELARDSIPGTILMPGEKIMPPAAARPLFPPVPRVFFDPIAGIRPPDDECLYDGGDFGIPAGVDSQGNLRGVEPADTAAAYTDSHGVRHVAISNRICVCVPRFMVAVSVSGLGGYANVTVYGRTAGVEAQAPMSAVAQSLLARQTEALEGARSREKASGAIGIQGPNRLSIVQVLNAYDIEIGPGMALGTEAVYKLTAAERVRLAKQMEFAFRLFQPFAGPRGAEQIASGPRVVGIVAGTGQTMGVVETRSFTTCCSKVPLQAPDRPLVLFKWADRQSAQVGEVVTFFLKYSNLGGRPITDVAVSDSLTPRLEYVPGSARTDRPAVFTTRPNEAGSLLLHWEVTGSLLPTQTGVVSFQARIR